MEKLFLAFFTEKGKVKPWLLVFLKLSILLFRSGEQCEQSRWVREASFACQIRT